MCDIGCLKKKGRIYQLTSCDCFSNFGRAKLYLHKTAENAVDFLDTDLLPKAGNVEMDFSNTLSILSDSERATNGKEFTTHWPNTQHKFKQGCARNGITERFTKVSHPWTNGYAESLNQSILDEFYSVVALRKKIYTSLQELQKDLDAFMAGLQLPEKSPRIQAKGEWIRYAKSGILLRQEMPCPAGSRIIDSTEHPEEKSVDHCVNFLTRQDTLWIMQENYSAL